MTEIAMNNVRYDDAPAPKIRSTARLGTRARSSAGSARISSNGTTRRNVAFTAR